MRRVVLLIVLSLAVASAAAFAAAAAARARVTITGRKFVPAALPVDVGDSVIWVNNDDIDHMIEADNGSFASGKLKRGQTYTHRFVKAGSYPYSCALHPREKGKIIVRK